MAEQLSKGDAGSGDEGADGDGDEVYPTIACLASCSAVAENSMHFQEQLIEWSF